MIEFREERVRELEERLSELQKTEQKYRQQYTDTKLPEHCTVLKQNAQNEAEEKTLDAIRALQNAEEEGCSEALADARRLLESPSTKSAASAYTAVADVAKMCKRETHPAVQTAVRAVRDVLVMRCRSQAVPGDRRSFLDTAEEAFGRPLHQELRAVLLLSYHKNTKNKSI